MPSGSRPLTGSSRSSGRRVAEQRGRDPEPLAHAERELAGALVGDLVQADEVDQLVDAALRDAVGLREREQVVVRRAAGVHGAGLEQRADLVQRRRVVAVVLAVDGHVARASGASRPRIRRIVVDLPEPFGPRKPVTMPGSTVKVRSSTARFVPVVLRQVARLDHPATVLLARTPIHECFLNMRVTLICLLCAVVVAGGAERARPAAEPTLEQLVGQKLVVSMSGTAPSASLLARARRGDIGGVLVHRFNFASSAQLRAIGCRAAAGRGERRPAPPTDRGRPGGRLGEDDPLAAAGPLARPRPLDCGRSRRTGAAPAPRSSTSASTPTSRRSPTCRARRARRSTVRDGPGPSTPRPPRAWPVPSRSGWATPTRSRR